MANLEYFSDEDVISFTLLDARTVERLQREGDIKLPKKKVDIPKDERWNTKQMSSKLLQGILAGDDIPTIAHSLMQVIGNNAAAAVRNARTMVTGAENVGRLDSYEDLAEKGVVQKKVWIATADDRTRESHLLLDGEEVDIDKPFSNGLMYPAEPSGDPAEVYNCRCSMRDHIVGFRRADGSISYVGAERDTTSHAGKIENEIAQRGLEKAAEVESSTVAQYVNEFETKGYVGLSEEESDAFMEKYHNEELLKNNQRDNERKGEESGHVVGSLFNRHVAEGNLDDRERERMKELDAAISANSLPQDMTLYRGVSYYTIPDLDVTGKSLEEIKDELNNMAGNVIGDGRYVQTSASSLRNFFTDSDISMQIIAEEGTPAYISNYLAESEIVLGRDSKFEILGADIVEVKDSYGLDHEQITLVVKLSTPAETAEAPAANDKFELIGGKNDPEITDSIYDYYLPSATRNRLDEISDMSTYNEFKDYFVAQGIELDTALESLKNERADDDIPAVKELLQKITVGIDSYKETFGEDCLSTLNKIVLYDEDLDTHAAYFFNLIGENDPDAGTIKFSDWNATGRDVFHELGHAFQDSMKADDEDIISFANRLAEEIDIPNSAYKGTSNLGEENAEMMAEALGFGFSQGLGKDVDFIEKLRRLLR